MCAAPFAPPPDNAKPKLIKSPFNILCILKLFVNIILNLTTNT